MLVNFIVAATVPPHLQGNITYSVQGFVGDAIHVCDSADMIMLANFIQWIPWT